MWLKIAEEGVQNPRISTQARSRRVLVLYLALTHLCLAHFEKMGCRHYDRCVVPTQPKVTHYAARHKYSGKVLSDLGEYQKTQATSIRELSKLRGCGNGFSDLHRHREGIYCDTLG